MDSTKPSLRKSPAFLLTLLSLLLPALSSTLDAAEHLARAQTAVPEKTPPNILVILADDLGWMDINAMATIATGTPASQQYYETPSLNQLAQEGVLFSRCSSTPLCTPSRASLLTGRNGALFGFNNAYAMSNAQTFAHMKKPAANGYLLYDLIPQLSPKLPLIPATSSSALPNGRSEDNGYKLDSLAEMLPHYRSAFLGKWHVGGGNLAGHRPQDFGFEAVAYQDEGWSDYFKGRQKWHCPGPQTQAEYLTDALTEISIDWLKKHHCQNPQQPFFLILSHFAVHGPFQAKAADIAYFEKKATRGWNQHSNPVYAAMLKSLDDSVGKLMKTLKELSLDQKTAIFFLSDNGGVQFHGPDGAITCNSPLSGQKAQTKEGGIRVPLIAHFPQKWPPGSKIDIPVNLCDIAPTLIELSATPISARVQKQLTGNSLMPLLKNQPQNFPSRPIYVHDPYYRPMPETPAIILSPSSVMIDGDYKLIAYHDGVDRLYHLPSDPGEKSDLSSTQPERVTKMKAKLYRWRIDQIPERYDTCPNPNYNPAAPGALPPISNSSFLERKVPNENAVAAWPHPWIASRGVSIPWG